jgi:hypothetical protein
MRRIVKFYDFIQVVLEVYRCDQDFRFRFGGSTCGQAKAYPATTVILRITHVYRKMHRFTVLNARASGSVYRSYTGFQICGTVTEHAAETLCGI